MKIILLLFIFTITGLSYSQSFQPKSSAEKNSPDYLKQLDNQAFITYNYIHNLGNFGDLYKDGSGFTVNYGKYFPNSWLAVFQLGYIKQNVRPGVDSGAYSDFKVYPIHVGGRFYVYKNIFMPYFSFMNGINLVSTSNFLGRDSTGKVAQPDQSLIRYAFQVGFGFDVKFTKNLGINASINYNNSFYEDLDLYFEQNSKMMTGFEYIGGLTYNFGK